MPKSQIIKDIVEERVALEQSLNRLYILAVDVKNETLARWVKKELNGYSTADDLPEYRRKTGLELKYSGINGSLQVTNQPLPLYYVRENHREKLKRIDLHDGIRYISELSSANSPSIRDVSYLASDVAEITNNEVQCISIKQIISQSVFQNVCANVKHLMIQALLELESKYGNLDKLGIDISGKRPEQIEANNEELNRIVFNINISRAAAQKEKLTSKIVWKILFPIFTAVVGAIISAAVVTHLGLG